MLTGRNLRAGRAKALGLVDAVVPERHVRGGGDGGGRAASCRRARRGLLVQLVNTAPGRKLAAKRMRSETAKKRARSSTTPRRTR